MSTWIPIVTSSGNIGSVCEATVWTAGEGVDVGCLGRLLGADECCPVTVFNANWTYTYKLQYYQLKIVSGFIGVLVKFSISDNYSRSYQ
jgi:hypothetical protein